MVLASLPWVFLCLLEVLLSKSLESKVFEKNGQSEIEFISDIVEFVVFEVVIEWLWSHNALVANLARKVVHAWRPQGKF